MTGEILLDVACQTPGGECAFASNHDGPRCIVRRTIWDRLTRPPALTRMVQAWPLEWHIQFDKAGEVGICLITPDGFDLVAAHSLEALTS